MNNIFKDMQSIIDKFYADIERFKDEINNTR